MTYNITTERATQMGNEKREMEAKFSRTFKATLDPRIYVTLIKEEMAEVEEAALEGPTAHYLKEVADLTFVMCGLRNRINDFFNIIPEEEYAEIRKLLSDASSLLVDAHQIFDLETTHTAYQRVFQSNMSKLGEDGRPIYREDGKILKGPNYKEPDLSDLVTRSIH